MYKNKIGACLLCLVTVTGTYSQIIPGEMVTIPAGEFIMGNKNGSWEEKPEHKVYLPAYQIGNMK